MTPTMTIESLPNNEYLVSLTENEIFGEASWVHDTLEGAYDHMEGIRAKMEACGCEPQVEWKCPRPGWAVI